MRSLALTRLRTHLSHLRHNPAVMQPARLLATTSPPDEDVIFHEYDTKKVIILNRPKALNALNLSMIKKIHPKLKAWKTDGKTSLIVMQGAGEKAFCAGGDIRAVTEAGQNGKNALESIAFFRNEYMLNYEIGTLPVPYVAIIDGITMGGGVGLSVHGKFRVATERSIFAMPETGIGLFPDVGGSYFLPRLKGKLGLYLALTGQRLSGEDLYHAGVATHFVRFDNGKLANLTNELVGSDTSSEDAVRAILQKYHNESFSGKAFSMEQYHSQINDVFDASSVEEIIDRLSQSQSEWHKKTLATLRRMSPTSLKVTMEQLRRGATLDLASCFTMELRIAYACMKGNDFYEGVRADKDNKPSWKPASLHDVSASVVASFFEPLNDEHELKLEAAR